MYYSTEIIVQTDDLHCPLSHMLLYKQGNFTLLHRCPIYGIIQIHLKLYFVFIHIPLTQGFLIPHISTNVNKVKR